MSRSRSETCAGENPCVARRSLDTPHFVRGSRSLLLFAMLGDSTTYSVARSILRMLNRLVGLCHLWHSCRRMPQVTLDGQPATAFLLERLIKGIAALGAEIHLLRTDLASTLETLESWLSDH